MKKIPLLLLTSFALTAFATNSVLCRFALHENDGAVSIDAASFTAIRLFSGALILATIIFFRTYKLSLPRLKILPVIMLFTYAICFSFSYIDIEAGVGALLLFGSVQLTMLLSGITQGEKLDKMVWIGILLAFTGLIYLVLPGANAPPLLSALLMIVAGIAWGLYSLAGREVKSPLITTGWNFIGTLPFVFIFYLISYSDIQLTQKGVILAVLSGALASSFAYVIWYRALPYLGSTRAATVQLIVPVLAMIGGVLFLAETVNTHQLLASIAILGGVYVTVKQVSNN